MTETIRLLIADDHLIVRQGLRLILETEPGFELIGEASDGAEAVQLADRVTARCDPDGFAHAPRGWDQRYQTITN